jgi:REP element-mobilizing transposase RayT
MSRSIPRGRRSIRLQGSNYSQPGAYFITICTYQKRSIFGEISNSTVHLNIEGEIARYEWWQTEVLRVGVCLDQFVIMPNHFHAILFLHRKAVGARRRHAPTRDRFGAPVAGSLATIVRSDKSIVTRRINTLKGTKESSVWQRNYYDHIIRYEQELNRIRQYILQNPLCWEYDRYFFTG